MGHFACISTAKQTGQGNRTPAQKSRRINKKEKKFRSSKLAGVTGLEPATSAVTGQRSEPIELHPRVWTAGKFTWTMTRHQPPLVHGLPAKARRQPSGGWWALKDLNL
jgi:hypothetical protein